MRTLIPFILAASAFAQLTPVIPNSAVQGAAGLTTVGVIPYVTATGTLGQHASSPTFNSSTGNVTFPGTITPSSGISTGGPLAIQGGGAIPISIGNGATYFINLYSTGGVSLGANGADSGYRLNILKSGSTGTLLVQDQTATTGITLAKFSAGAGQSTNDLIQIANNGGTKQVWIDSSYAQHGNTWYTLNNTAQALMLRSNAGIAWATTANSDSGTYGTGLSGNIAGLVTVSNGTVGNANASIQAEWHLIAGITTIASATTIAPTKSMIRVTGSTTIQTITVPSVFQSYTGAQLVIIPDTGATWATNTSGNIAVASTAVVGKPLIMIYDAYVSKWYPSY